MAFVYHRIPSNLEGGVLYPLNVLATVYPRAAEVHRAKYTGREAVTQARIPPLGCLWNDVLMLSSVHPCLLLDALRDSGRSVPVQRWYAVDASLLEPDRTTLFIGPLQHTDHFSSSDYLPFTPSTLHLHALPTSQSLARLRQTTQSDRVALFADVAHVFYRGTLAVESLQEIEV